MARSERMDKKDDTIAEVMEMWGKIGFMVYLVVNSPFDVVAVKQTTQERMDVVLVQCKNTVMTEAQVEHLGQAMGLKTGKATVRVFVAHKIKGEKETKLSEI